MGSDNFKRFNFGLMAGLIAAIFVAPSMADLSALESNRTTCSYLRSYGADCETHKVTTDDGYILTLFRVICEQDISTTKSGVALLMHGIIESSSDFVLLGNNSLGLFLCKQGYDVWLGNSRGNRYSKEHVTLSPLNPAYWKFSWHEMGIYDLPAVIEYILDLTEESKLHYVGHSQGTTEYFIYASKFSDKANNTIHSAHLMAPVGYMYHATSPFFRIGVPLLGSADPLSYTLGDAEFLPNTILTGLVGETVCLAASPLKPVCNNLYDAIMGYSDNVDEDFMSEWLHIFPSGASLRQYKHYCQVIGVEDSFRPYDFGTVTNLLLYGSATPQNYELENISVKTYAYYGGADIIAAPIDVDRTLAQLDPSVLKRKAFYPTYNHLDVLYARNVLEEVNYLIEEDMANSKEN